ncbi:molybdopterin converting factor subunit 1 [Halobacillus shinanisalinarum]|uniref:Molybdopterin synthase sulfur carrier subunit n=1 Tax=Halobacillus shinanisalinarum TaxID=2932258 RepID=A0ABY4GY21_9BACI|nr:molybdopterin converting factor subunit 1 [Halobacillus shinanisalinarum]UOQ92820.1 molybdopterin converting factor subunit 1 [Halobacillus shinanisalinarum]
MNRILFFADLQEKVGQESLKVDVTGKTVTEVKEYIGKQFQLDRLNEAMTAINEEYADNLQKIGEGDVVAFIPPVSGG